MTPILPCGPLAEVPPIGPEPPSDAQRFGQWLRREMSAPAFRRGWRRRLGVVFVLGGVVLLLCFGGRLSDWQQVGLWSGLGLYAAVLTRGLWFGLFGPVLFFDLVRTARKGRSFLLRGGYLVAVLGTLVFVYSSHPSDDLFGEMRLDQHELTEFAAHYFFLFLAVQFGAIFLLTPIFTATAIAEEKERKTLDDLLTTDLRSREIVLGKLAARLLALLLLLASGLPVLSFVQFLGGVDPNLVLAGFVASVVTLLSLGSLGILNSVYARRPRGAIASTYVIAGAYLVLTSCLAPSVSRSGPNLLTWIASGNIIVAYAQVGTSANAASGTTGAEVFTVLWPYVVFHTTVLVMLTAVATLKLRVWNGEEPSAAPRLPAPVRSSRSGRVWLPPIGKDIILWKELYAEPGSWSHPLAHALLWFAGGAFLFASTVVFLGSVMWSVWTNSFEFVTVWVRMVGTMIGNLLIVAVAIRASRSFGTERDRHTLDSLLMTPLSNMEILRGKWLGALLSVRPAWCLLGAIWLLGLLGGGLHILSLLLLLGAWWVYALFAALLGLTFSLRCRTTLRATICTLIVLLVLSAAPLLFYGGWPPRPIPEIDKADMLLAMSPPRGMVALTFGWKDLSDPSESTGDGVASAVLGLCCYLAVAHVLLSGLRLDFRHFTGRR